LEDFYFSMINTSGKVLYSIDSKRQMRAHVFGGLEHLFDMSFSSSFLSE